MDMILINIYFKIDSLISVTYCVVGSVLHLQHNVNSINECFFSP